MDRISKPPSSTLHPPLHAPTQPSMQAQRPLTVESLASVAPVASRRLGHSLFARTSQDALAKLGMQVDAQLVLDDVPGFVAVAHQNMMSMSGTRRAQLRCSPDLIAVLLAEAKALQDVLRDRGAPLSSSTVALQVTSLRSVTREATALRDSVCEHLVIVFGQERLAYLDGSGETMGSCASLAAELESLAEFLRRSLSTATDEEKELLRAFGLNVSTVEALDLSASRLWKVSSARTADDESEREIELRAGRVLHLLGRILHAFQHARRADTAIVLPPLPRIGWVFEAGG